MEKRIIDNIVKLIYENDFKILEKLLKHFPNLDLDFNFELENRQQCFLGYALNFNHEEIVNLLLESGASLNNYINEKTIPIYIIDNHLSMYYDLLEKYPIDYELKTKKENNALLWYLIKNNLNDLIKKIIKNPDLSWKNNLNQSYLWIAAAANNEEYVKLLVDYELDIYESDNVGIAPIHLLIKNDIKLALYDINYLDNFGNNLLMIALQNDNILLSKLILKYYNDFEYINYNKESVLELIVKKMPTDEIHSLYNKNPNVFCYLEKMESIFDWLIKRNLNEIVINLINSFESKLDFNKVITACLINDQLDIFKTIKFFFLKEYHLSNNIFKKITELNAIKILDFIYKKEIFKVELIDNIPLILEVADFYDYNKIKSFINVVEEKFLNNHKKEG
ncbi:MAG: hypothetical protein ACRCW6_01435 [Mycoplasmoidaceae bacterium]